MMEGAVVVVDQDIESGIANSEEVGTGGKNSYENMMYEYTVYIIMYY